jgi:hypothetical protein
MGGQKKKKRKHQDSRHLFLLSPFPSTTFFPSDIFFSFTILDLTGFCLFSCRRLWEERRLYSNVMVSVHLVSTHFQIQLFL